MAVRFCSHRRTALGVLIFFFLIVIVCTIAVLPPTRPASTGDQNYLQELDDHQRNGPVPQCENTTFCVETPYYPLDYVNSILAINKQFTRLATNDEVVMDVEERIYSVEDGDPLCNSKIEPVRPKSALTRNSEWHYVANTPNYVQTLRVEVCISENSVCNIIDGFADGYVTKCKQMYMYRELVSVSRRGELTKEFFRIPSSCKCFVKFTGNPFVRMGVSLGKKKSRDPITKKKN